MLWEFFDISYRIDKILYAIHFAHLANKNIFYHICSGNGQTFVEEPLKGVKDSISFGSFWNRRFMFIKIGEASGFPLFGIV